MSFLAEAGVSPGELLSAVDAAARTGRDVADIVVERGLLAEENVYRALARHLGAPFISGPLRLARTLRAPPPDASAVPLAPGSGPRFALAPRGAALDALASSVRPGSGWALAGAGVSTPSQVAAAIRRSMDAALAREAANRLPDAWPAMSVRDGFTRAEGLCGLAAVGAASIAVAGEPLLAGALLFGAFNLLFAFVVALRLAACLESRAEADPPLLPDAQLPVYTILAPLLREGGVLPQLVRALDALDYPKRKLDIKLLVEADDEETLAAARDLSLPDHVDVVVCPPGRPRTKPRALNIGLKSARGDLLVVYDAEDVPNPGQLRLAASAFARSGPRLACLQARLSIHNGDAGWLPRLFAFEYAALFHVVLPGYSRMGAPIPLGGTSNHFRVSVLRKVLGWDAWNVAEDADLGLRLARLGYGVRTLNSSTREEAVLTVRAWMSQRSRWLKGWMQATLVHGRAVWGRGRFPAFDRVVVLAHTLGVVLAALGQPFFMAVTLARILDGSLWAPSSPVDAILASLSGVVLAGGALALVWPMLTGARREGLRMGVADLLVLPLYYALWSAAAWRAAWELIWAPQRWNKTTHGLAAPKPAPKPASSPRNAAPAIASVRPASVRPALGPRATPQVVLRRQLLLRDQ
ncbi:glycosyltransferase family 2 protein [Alsobacter sp. KACC 23698]|uniref:Glycosyltransferase family 2 protein n=1 Tax=Alsobacter sp. KACC 23698 TaxID=3149229 RepID=A0AAU7JH72_9HYPH